MAGCGGGAKSAALPGLTAIPLSKVRAAASASYVDVIAADNPIAYYRLNDTSVTMLDSGKHHLSGLYGANVIHGGTALTSDTGAASSIFPGSPAGSAIAPNTGTVETNGLFASAVKGLTIEAWIKPAALNQTNHYVPLVSYGREAQGQAWLLMVSPQSTLNVWLKATGGKSPFYLLKGGTTLLPSKEYQVVATYDGTSVKSYINGELEGSIAATGSIDYSSLLPQWGLGIGGALGSLQPVFGGDMSDVSIYPLALSPTDILNHFAAGKLSVPAPSGSPSGEAYASLVGASSPLAYYKLNDAGSTMSDSGPHRLSGSYGAAVRHGSAALTSAGDASSVFPGSPAGSDISVNAGTVVANSLFATASTALTVEAWVDPAGFNGTNSFVPLVAYGRQVIGSAWALEMTPQSGLAFYLKVNGGLGSYLLKTGILSPARIYQVVATYDGASAKLYVNGSLITSEPATGSINYLAIAPQYGLGVGGALGGSLPIFNGEINDVSIYPTALSPAVVENHYLVGHLAQPLIEKPVSSDAFVDSIGVVTHLRESASPYTTSWSTFATLLQTSGIRHIGDALIATPAWYPQHIAQLASSGIHASLIANMTQTYREITLTIPLFQGSVEAIEGPNEPDLGDMPNWVEKTRDFQRMLWATVKADPSTTSLKVVGPSMITLADSVAFGNFSSCMDVGSIHEYFDGYNPGTVGWGNVTTYGVYGSILYDRNIAAIASGTKPAMSTETGYSSSTANLGGVDSRTLARYIPRLYLEQFLRGIQRTTLYEFYDEPFASNFDRFGLVGLDNVPKSSYFAIKSLIGILADPGSAFSPNWTKYALTGNISNLDHLLLQKRDGTYELVIWAEVQSYDPIAKLDIGVPAQAVTLEPATAPASATISTIGDSGQITTTPLAFGGGIATFSVDDRVTIVSFK